MEKYTATIEYYGAYNRYEVEANTPQEALQLVLGHTETGEDQDLGEVTRYDDPTSTLERVQIEGDEGVLTEWLSPQERMNQAAPEMLAALEAVADAAPFGLNDGAAPLEPSEKVQIELTGAQVLEIRAAISKAKGE